MRSHADFPEHADENRRIWNANARWWDDRIGEGNDFQTLLIEPATERLLNVTSGDTILDVACGAGRFTRRMASLGATVVAIDTSSEFIARARERTPSDASIDYRVLDAARLEDLRSLGANRFTKAVCTMAVMDMPEIAPLFRALAELLPRDGAFVFSVTASLLSFGDDPALRGDVRRRPGPARHPHRRESVSLSVAIGAKDRGHHRPTRAALLLSSSTQPLIAARVRCRLCGRWVSRSRDSCRRTLRRPA